MNINLSDRYVKLQIVVIVLLLVVLPLTVILLGQQQTFFQQAATVNQLVIYNDSLASGWTDWSGQYADVNLNNRTQIYNGNYAISYIASRSKKSEFYLHTNVGVSTSSFTTLHFALKAAKDGQHYSVQFINTNDGRIGSPLPLSNTSFGDPVAASWKVYDISLLNLNAVGSTVKGLLIEQYQNTNFPMPKLYIDDIRLLGNSPTSVPTPTGIISTPSPRPTSSPTPTSSSNSSGCIKMTIPAYFYPGALWDQSISGYPNMDIMIMNPASGPGSSKDSNYVTYVNKAKNAGVKVLGYVATTYGAKNSSTVQSEINSYKSFYGVTDIFFDEVSSSSSYVSYYQNLVNYVHSNKGIVMLNPGIVPAEQYVSMADKIITFENSYSSYTSASFPSWINNYPASKIVHLVYGVSDANSMQNVVNLARQRNVGNLYVTNDVLSNPWDTLPSYWSNELSSLQSSCGTVSPTITGVPTPTSVIPTVTPRPTSIPTPTPNRLTPTPTSVQTGGMWLPSSTSPIHWQWQLSAPLTSSNLIPNVTVYDIDGFDNDASIVSTLHSMGYKAICYIDVGTYENWRSDAGSFPSSVLGSNVSGWAGEKWLDIRQISILQPIMSNRMAMCKQKGFDAVEPDNMDGYTNSTGFSLSAQNQIDYNKMIASVAHSYGMSVGQKNDIDQVSTLVQYFDWVLNEECYKYNECSSLTTYMNAGKAVFEVEYGSSTNQCSSAKSSHFNSMTRDLNLTAGGTRLPCVSDNQNSW